MNDDDNIEPENDAPELPTIGDVFFDDAGEPVAITTPYDTAVEADDTQDDAITGTDYGGFLALLTIGAQSADAIGKRAALLKYVMLPPDQRGTLEDLGRLLGVTKQRAHAVLTTFRLELPKIANEIGFRLPPNASSY